MDSEVRPASDSCNAVMDDGVLDSLLERLVDGQLGQRIMDAAQIAVAEHMVNRARQVQSPVESEDSAT